MKDPGRPPRAGAKEPRVPSGSIAPNLGLNPKANPLKRKTRPFPGMLSSGLRQAKRGQGGPRHCTGTRVLTVTGCKAGNSLTGTKHRGAGELQKAADGPKGKRAGASRPPASVGCCPQAAAGEHRRGNGGIAQFAGDWTGLGIHCAHRAEPMLTTSEGSWVPSLCENQQEI